MADDQNQGYGQQNPSDSGSAVNSTAFMIYQILGRTRTVTLAKVVGVSEVPEDVGPVGFVDVQPIVKLLDGNNNVTSHGTVHHVPYLRMQGGKNALILDPKVGDIGILLVADRDISAVKASKAEAQPGSKRQFSLADGLYVGGVLNDTPEQYVRFTDDGVEIADKNSNKLTSNSTGWVFTGNVIMNNNLQLTGALQGAEGAVYPHDLKTSGDVIAQGKSLASHVHDYTRPTTGGTPAQTGQPT